MKLRVRSHSKGNVVLSNKPTLQDYALYLGAPALFLLLPLFLGEASNIIFLVIGGIFLFNAYVLYRVSRNAVICILDGTRNTLLLLINRPTGAPEEHKFALDVVQGTYLEEKKTGSIFSREDKKYRLSLRVNYNLLPLTTGYELSQDEAEYIRDLVNELIKPFKPQQEMLENFKTRVATIMNQPPPDDPTRETPPTTTA